MADYVISPPPVTSVPVAGGGDFPVRRVFCVGRNYAEHAREMGSDPDREPPFFFMKPADALLLNDADMPYPPRSSQLHHEMELVVAIGEGGADIAEADALAHVWGYAAGLDMTRRDLQNAAKKEGKPWDMGKGFDHSAPIGLMVPAAKIGHPATRPDRIEGERPRAPDLRSVEDDLERAGDDRLPVRAGEAGARRSDLHRHAGKCRRRGAGRPAGGRRRRRRHGADPHRLMPVLRVATWNINSLRLRVGLLYRLVEALDPDVICLQETKVPDVLFPADGLQPLGYPHTVFRGMKGYNGVAILSRLPLEVHDGAPDWCGKGDCRHVAARIPTPGGAIELHNFYVPAGGDVPDRAPEPEIWPQAGLHRRSPALVRRSHRSMADRSGRGSEYRAAGT